MRALLTLTAAVYLFTLHIFGVFGMYPYLVADIGGTNARFAIVTTKMGGEFIFEDIKILETREHASFEGALQTYLNSTSHKPTAACIAIAGPVDGDRIKMTNLSWEFQGTAVSKQFGFEKTLLMNDFAAVAAACSQMTAEYLTLVKAGTASANGNKVVFGPGTGLGVAGLVNSNGNWLPVPTEGGHINIAASSAYEAEIINSAILKFGHVSAEMFVSGPGLINLYHAVCAVDDAKTHTYKPSEITQKAIDGSDEHCIKTLNLFISFAGSFAGNLALTYGAKGGVYIAGGIVPRILNHLKAGSFTEKFTSKGVMSRFVEPIPVQLMTHPETAFVGAAAWLEQHCQNSLIT